MLRIFGPECWSCLRQVDNPAHRTVLALGVAQLLPELSRESSGYVAQYVNHDQEAAQAIFHAGQQSIIWDRSLFDALPYSDLSFDVAIVNVSALENVQGGAFLASVLAEVVRTLSPAGTLVVSSQVAFCGGKHMAWLGQLLVSTAFINVFTRTDRMDAAPDLPPCTECGMPNPFQATMTRGSISTAADDKDHRTRPSDVRCQPYIQAHYLPLSDQARLDAIAGDEAGLAAARLRTWPVENVMHTLPSAKAWVEWYSEDAHQNKSFRNNYAGAIPVKLEWDPMLSGLIRSGRVKSLLDAGAGSCTVAGQLRSEGLLPHLKPYMSFGSYDCSCMRICFERGEIIFQYNWLRPLPLCASCKFDLIFQANGIHHTDAADLESVFDNFDHHLHCNGTLFIEDLPSSPGATSAQARWPDVGRVWAQRKGYRVVDSDSSRALHARIVIEKFAC